MVFSVKLIKRIISATVQHRTWLLISFVVIVIGVGSYAVFKSQPTKYTYITQPVQQGTLINDVTGTGNLTYAQSSVVNSQVSGTISGIDVQPGQMVTVGEPLFNIQNNSLKATADKLYATYLQDKQAISNDEALIMQDENNLNNDNASVVIDQSPTATLSQQQSLVTAEQQQNVARQQLTTAQLALTADQSTERADWAAYEVQLTTIAEANITAPINGLVVSVNISPGQYVSGSSGSASAANNPEMLIVNPSSLEAGITLNEVDAVKVQPGQTVQLSFNAIPNLNLTGTVASVNPIGTVTQGVVTYNVIVALSTSNPQLKSGMSVTANITTEAKNNVISVPSTAIKTNSSGQQYVQLLENAKPVNVNITTGIVTNNGTEVTSGLKAGELVITQTISNKPPKSLSQVNGGNLLKLNGGGGFRGGGAKARAGKP